MHLVSDQPYEDSLFGTTPEHIRALKEMYKALSGRKPRKSYPSLEHHKLIERFDRIQRKREDVRESLEKLRKEITRLQPLGDFDIEPIKKLQDGGIFIKIYSAHQKAFDEYEFPTQVEIFTIRRTGSNVIFAVAATSDVELPFNDIKLPEQSLHELRAEEATLVKVQEMFEEELDNMSSLLPEIEKAIVYHEDILAYKKAIIALTTHGEVFSVTGWIPADELPRLESFCNENGLALLAKDPSPKDNPPTLIKHNKTVGKIGKSLIDIYDTPNYQDFDTSSTVFWFFTVFFGMIIADGGYGFLLLLLSLYLKHKHKDASQGAQRFLLLCTVLSLSTMIYGILTATYFGWTPPSDSIIYKIAPLAIPSYEEFKYLRFAMMVSLWAGAVNIAWMNIKTALSERKVAPLGWIMVLAGGMMFTIELNEYGFIGLALGMAFVMVVSGIEQPGGFLTRLLKSISALQGAIQLFSDILSYLRLFALAMAGVYMAKTFNMLAGMIYDAAPLWLSAISCPLILVFGHTINVVLCIMGGVIHGLRLNFIESYHWGFEGGGRIYNPFRKASIIQADQK